MSIAELAAFVCSHLRSSGIDAVLSGGGTVSIYTTNRYQSFDLDFIVNLPTTRPRIRQALAELGFTEERRYFRHAESQVLVEFPAGPLAVGDEPVREVVEISYETGVLRLISPTDCVKDRLAGYYHWGDRQCLEQALMVAEDNAVDIAEVRRWSRHGRKEADFVELEPLLLRAQQKRKKQDT